MFVNHLHAGPSARSCSLLVMLGAALCLTVAGTRPALAQPSFSIDWHSPPVGVLDPCWGAPLTEGDILTLAFFQPPKPGPLPPPCISISGGFGPPMPGLAIPTHPAAMGHPPGVMGRVEVDALSYGFDHAPKPGFNPWVDWYFSVDEFATGFPGTPQPPSLFTEGAAGARDASADIFVDVGLGGIAACGPLAPNTGNTAYLDGDGIPPYGGFGVGLIEPNPPTPGVPGDPGSNLDALDVDIPVGPGAPFPVFYSLDSGLPDPLELTPNSASAVANGFVGGDVLVCWGPGAPPLRFAGANQLGLDLFGPDTDDLDALTMTENGTGMFEPPTAPFSWLTGQTDAIFFSVRRGSMLVLNRVLDSRCGLPIEEGDILIPPFQQGLPPAIWIRAEMLGLATVRTGTLMWPFGDDLDALDVKCRIPADLDRDGDVDL
ncbi:MAG: hypothetical protein HZB38_17475, partial [Planctomycetes bacterium]|nr:hypothetical protein [Planctomycetota bacterium]